VPPKPEPPGVEPRPEPPKAEPPKPEPTVEPKPVPPKVEPAKLESKPEPPKSEPPLPKPRVDPKPDPPKPEPPKPEPPPRVVVRPEPKPEAPPKPLPLARAAALIRESTPLLGDVAEVLDDTVLRRMDRVALLEHLDTVRRNLEQARSIYAESRDGAPDPVLDRRINVLSRVLEAVPAAEDRVRVSEALEKAARQIREATPLGREVAEGVESPPGEELDQLELRVKAALLKEKLREARTIYASVRDRAPDPGLIDARIVRIERILSLFEGR
jgi:hypothetical protein